MIGWVSDVDSDYWLELGGMDGASRHSLIDSEWGCGVATAGASVEGCLGAARC